ncbi:MAG: hypothetical protein A2Y33_03425 [Spirochaetes bacterium GWF1_51_8]|nr:MAG: hypothetical protein A2Y33_03425 [Spirochaetes bacterium GWF1_51_8]
MISSLPSTQATANSKNDEAVEVTFLAASGAPDEQEVYDELIAEFRKENPGITVKKIEVDWLLYHDKLRTMCEGGESPDVVMVSVQYFAEWADKGYFLPIDGYKSDAELEIGDFYPKLIDMFTYRDNLYCIPKDWTTFVIYYNRDVFAKARMKQPSSSWTWDDFLNVAKKTTADTNADNVIDRYSFMVETWADWYLNWVFLNGGSVFDENGEWLMANGENLNRNSGAIQFLADLIFVHQVAPQVDGALSGIGCIDAFKQQKIAMCMAGYWGMKMFSKIDDFQWGYCTLPGNSVNASSILGRGFAISAKSQHPEAAWKLVKFLAKPASMKKFIRFGMSLPARQSLVVSNEYLDIPGLLKNQPHLASIDYLSDPFVLQLEDATLPFNIPEWEMIRNRMEWTFDEVFLGNQLAKVQLLILDHWVGKNYPHLKWKSITVEE